jgi:hypothetical protein
MACTQTVSFGNFPTAQMGQATNFVLAIANNTGSNTNIQSIQPVVRKMDNTLFAGAQIGPLTASPELGLAQVGGNQFNVPITNGSTLYFGFSVAWPAPAIAGGPTQPPLSFMLDCITSTSDGSSFGCNSPLLVNVNQPLFGQAPGSPPNPSASVGQLDFQAGANATLAL